MMKIRLIIRSIKHLFQKVFRGFPDSDTWALDFTISKYILPRLKRYKEIGASCPASFSEGDWNKIIDKMLYAFEYIIEDSVCLKGIGGKDYEKYEEGINLFARYFDFLWW